MVIGTCQNCKDRFLGCHGVCEKYIAAKKEYDAKKAVASKQRNREGDYYDYKINAIMKNKKRKGLD